MEQTLRWSLAPKRDDHIPRAASHASATVDARQLGASRPQQRAYGSNKCLCPSGAGCRLTTLLTLLHCQVSRSVRVPALSVGAGEGNSLAYQRRLQVPKLNGVQVTDGKQEPTHKWSRCVRDLLCELAIELFDMDKLNPCTCVPFVSFRYPRSV